MSRMRFIAHLGDREHEIIVNNHAADDGYYTMTLDGKDYEVDAQLMRSHIVSTLIDHRSYDVDIEKVGDPDDTLDGRMRARVRGRVVSLNMLDERRHKMKEAASAHLHGEGVAQIDSPMPGKVLKLLVSEGDEVTQGQGIVVVEAMKMENELKSPKDGTVTRIDCKEGQAVNAGATLIIIE